MAEFIKSTILVITQKSARLRESGLLDECAPQIQSSRSGWQPGVLSSWAQRRIYCGLLGNHQNNKLVVYEKMVVMLF